MSLYTNIKFSNELIENKACNITYSGYLFEKNSTCVSIVYGFGPEWKHTTEQKMEKTDEGFVATINIKEFDSINFCFKNLDNEWDNNYNQNYTSPISKPAQNETQEIQAQTPEYDFILNNENEITTILDNLFSVDLSNPIYNQPLKMDTDLEEIEEVIVKSEVTTESIEDTSFEVAVEINKPVNIEETLVNISEAEGLTQDLENLFNEMYDKVSEENIETASLAQSGDFDMNNLINEILSPIVKSSVFEENVKESLENYVPEQNNSVNFFDDFEDFEDDLSVDNKIDSLIADLFNNTKEAREKAEDITFHSQSSISAEEPLFIEQIETNQPDLEIEEQYSEDFISENVKAAIEDLEKAIDNRIEELLSTSPVIENVEMLEENNNIEISENTNGFADLFEETENEEESLIETINNSQDDENQTTALIEIPDENNFTVSPRSLGKFYMFKKKVKLAFTKLFVAIPRYLSKGFNNENN